MVIGVEFGGGHSSHESDNFFDVGGDGSGETIGYRGKGYNPNFENADGVAIPQLLPLPHVHPDLPPPSLLLHLH